MDLISSTCAPWSMISLILGLWGMTLSLQTSRDKIHFLPRNNVLSAVKPRINNFEVHKQSAEKISAVPIIVLRSIKLGIKLMKRSKSAYFELIMVQVVILRIIEKRKMQFVSRGSGDSDESPYMYLAVVISHRRFWPVFLRDSVWTC